MTDSTAPEPTEEPTGALPAWYDPSVPLVVCVDGPRAGAWYAADWHDNGWLTDYHPSGANPIPHRLDARIMANPLTYQP